MIECIVAHPTEQTRTRMKSVCEAGGFTVRATLRDGLRVLDQIQRVQPQVVILHQVLPTLDAREIIRRIPVSSVERIPDILVTTVTGLPVGRMGEQAVLTPSPLTVEALVQAQSAFSAVRESLYRRMMQRAEAQLIQLGMPDHPGRAYLATAIAYSSLDRRYIYHLMDELYPLVAQTYQLDQRRVERAMRHAVDKAWMSSEIDAQFRVFRNTIDAQRGMPTCGALIARLVDMIRIEEAQEKI